MSSTEPRAEEIIAEAFRQKTLAVREGQTVTGVVLSRANYDRIQQYHARLGELSGEVEDYIGKYTLFGMQIYIDNSEFCRVLTE